MLKMRFVLMMMLMRVVVVVVVIMMMLWRGWYRETAPRGLRSCIDDLTATITMMLADGVQDDDDHVRATRFCVDETRRRHGES